MNLNVNSWHAKLVKFVSKTTWNEIEISGQVSLCKYFWVVVSSIVQTLFMFSFFTASFCFIGLIIYSTITFMLMVVFGQNFEFTKEFTEMVVGLGIIGIMVSSFILVQFISKKIRNNKIDKIDSQKPPSLLMAYINAKKQKICPILKIGD